MVIRKLKFTFVLCRPLANWDKKIIQIYFLTALYIKISFQILFYLKVFQIKIKSSELHRKSVNIEMMIPQVAQARAMSLCKYVSSRCAVGIYHDFYRNKWSKSQPKCLK